MTWKYKFSTYADTYREFGLKSLLADIWTDIIWPFKRTYRFIIKLFKYGKLLWYDYEFDYVYLLRVMQLKFNLMAEHFERDGHLMCSERRAEELRLCANLIERIVQNDYSELPLSKLTEMYGEIKWEFTPTEHPSASRLHIFRERAKEGTPEYEDEKKKFKKIMEAADAQKQRDIDYLCDTMKKLQQWWD